jgi:hypothetical protein
MTTGWLKNITVLSVLGALFFLRMMDLAVFDADHDHLEKVHAPVPAAEMTHAHHDDETSEHDTLATMSAHIGFHTLLGVFIDTAAANTVPSVGGLPLYGPHENRSAVTHRSRPPVPPPLA